MPEHYANLIGKAKSYAAPLPLAFANSELVLKSYPEDQFSCGRLTGKNKRDQALHELCRYFYPQMTR